jgi:hypothetical protein
MRYNEQKVLPYIRAMVWRCYKISLRGFRRELRIVSKCGCLSESEGRVSTGAFTNQTCAVNRNRSEIFITPPDHGYTKAPFVIFKKEKSHQNGGSK